MDFTHPQIEVLIDLAFQEDIGSGDHSSMAAIAPHTKGESKIVFKQAGVVAGLGLAGVILHKLDSEIEFNMMCSDGQFVTAGTVIATAHGSVHSLLAAERLVLNFLQRLSGIATCTKAVVESISDYKTTVLDTRKTTPGMRLLEKWAVSIGGGGNHRMGLYDMIMLKDNHIDSSGGITNAVKRTREYLQKNQLNLKIEVETRTMEEVREAIATGAVDRIMLDNFSAEDCSEAVQWIAGRVETEASGGIHPGNIREFAASGVDYISLGYLTHSAGSIDISMKTRMLQ